MCKPHWREYTNALRKAALARKAADADPVAAKPRTIKPVPKPAKKPKRGGKRSPFALSDPAPMPDALAPENNDAAVDDAAFVRDREAELDRAAQASNAARETADIEEASIA